MSRDPAPPRRLRPWRGFTSLVRFRRRQTAYRHLWQGRLIFWGGAVAIGLLAILFAKLTEEAVDAVRVLSEAYPWWVFLSAPLGGALIVHLTRRYFPGSEGSGIPQVMAELAQHGQHSRLPHPLLSLRIVVGKILLGSSALFCGFSTGREGPMVQVGASVMHAIGEKLPRRLQVDRRHLLAAGGAAGIAAAFNTPLAGIMFAIEELSRGLQDRMNGLIIMAIVIAGVVAQAYLGHYSYFGWIEITESSELQAVGPLLLLALGCGLAGGLFARLLILTAAGLPGPLGRWRTGRPVLFAAGCGLLVACIGWVSDGTSYGTGYTAARGLLAQNIELPWHYGLDKFLATLLSFASGIPGGIFAPALAIGAGLGQNMQPLAEHTYLPGMVNALCMAGFLAGVTQTPITAFVIVMEMVNGYGMVVDLMLITLLSSGVSRAICPPLYRTVATRLLASRPHAPQASTASP